MFFSSLLLSSLCLTATGCQNEGGIAAPSAANLIDTSPAEDPINYTNFGNQQYSSNTNGIQKNSNSSSSGKQVQVGEKCQRRDPNHLCLAVNYVVYANSLGKPIVTPQEAAANIKEINKVWNQCNLGFQIEKFQTINPSQVGLKFHTADSSELDEIRNAKYADGNSLLVVTTGKWDRSGSLGSTGANAWTAMPGSGPYGAVLEASVGSFANIIAHELGHYIGLDHVSDSNDLMNPIIYDNSTELTKDQCENARNTIAQYWSNHLR